MSSTTTTTNAVNSISIVNSVFERLLLLLGLDERETFDAAIAAYESPLDSVFDVPTQTLSKFLKLLKTNAPPESRPLIEEAFMKLVTTVSVTQEIVSLLFVTRECE